MKKKTAQLRKLCKEKIRQVRRLKMKSTRQKEKIRSLATMLERLGNKNLIDHVRLRPSIIF